MVVFDFEGAKIDKLKISPKYILFLAQLKFINTRGVLC